MTVVVTPDSFTKVDYNPERIAALAAESVALVSSVSPGLDLELRIDEDAATSRVSIASMEPVVFELDSGAIENYKQPRTIGELETKIAVARLLMELRDRRDPSFGGPALDDEVAQAHRNAWHVSLYGRVGRLGLRLHKPRFLYDFRNRHGFSDAADRIFDQLWSNDHPTWADITSLSDEAVSSG